MLNLTPLGQIRKIDNAFIYLHFLDSFLEGISDQRNRIKETAANHNRLSKKLFSSDTPRGVGEEFFDTQKILFREIRVFFWWWHSTYKLLWTGEKVEVNDKILLNIGCIKIVCHHKREKTASLIRILNSESFNNLVEKHRIQIRKFSDTRSKLEHILKEIHRGGHDLGNLQSNSRGDRKFLFNKEEIDISDTALDVVDPLAADINWWLQEQQ